MWIRPALCLHVFIYMDWWHVFAAIHSEDDTAGRAVIFFCVSNIMAAAFCCAVDSTKTSGRADPPLDVSAGPTSTWTHPDPHQDMPRKHITVRQMTL